MDEDGLKARRTEGGGGAAQSAMFARGGPSQSPPKNRPELFHCTL